jgi:hypothetical protein
MTDVTSRKDAFPSNTLRHVVRLIGTLLVIAGASQIWGVPGVLMAVGGAFWVSSSTPYK